MRFSFRFFLIALLMLVAAGEVNAATPVHWIVAASGRIPAGAIVGGHEESGQTLLLCRTQYNGGLHPGKVVGSKCNIGWGGAEVSLPVFEIAVGTVSWVAASNGNVPPGALIAGGEPGRQLPVCRVAYNNGVHPGKVVVDQCNFGWGGQEITSRVYEAAVDVALVGGTGATGSDSGRRVQVPLGDSPVRGRAGVPGSGSPGTGNAARNQPETSDAGNPVSPDSGQPARNGQAADLNAVARRCSDIAAEQYPYQAQNQLLQRAACTYYCAYNITGDQRYYNLYKQSQANANTLCSMSVGSQCNDISPLSRCNYR